MPTRLPDITVIIPVHNMQDRIAACLASVLEQDCSVAVIIVDDFSLPAIDVPQVGADPRVTLVRHTHNQGAAAARNTGVGRCQTEWVTFLDADDRLLPGTLADRLAHARAADTGGPAIFGCGWVYGDGPQVRIPRDGEGLGDFTTGCWYSPGSCILARRSLLTEVPFATGYSRLEDFDWAIRFGQAGGKLVVTDLAGTDIEPGYNSSYATVLHSSARLLKQFTQLATTHPPAWNNINAYLQLELASSAVAEKMPARAILHLVKSLWHRPRLARHFSPGWRYEKRRRPT